MNGRMLQWNLDVKIWWKRHAFRKIWSKQRKLVQFASSFQRISYGASEKRSANFQTASFCEERPCGEDATGPLSIDWARSQSIDSRSYFVLCVVVLANCVYASVRVSECVCVCVWMRVFRRENRSDCVSRQWRSVSRSVSRAAARTTARPTFCADCDWRSHRRDSDPRGICQDRFAQSALSPFQRQSDEWKRRRAVLMPGDRSTPTPFHHPGTACRFWG